MNRVLIAQSLQDGVNQLQMGVATAGSGLATGTASNFILGVVTWMLSFVAILATGALIWGGFMYITALGDEDKAAKAKRVILYAVIGILLAGGSFAIVLAIGQGLFNVVAPPAPGGVPPAP